MMEDERSLHYQAVSAAEREQYLRGYLRALTTHGQVPPYIRKDIAVVLEELYEKDFEVIEP